MLIWTFLKIPYQDLIVDLDFLEDTLSRSDITELDKTDLIIKEALKNNSEDDKSIVIIK